MVERRGLTAHRWNVERRWYHPSLADDRMKFVLRLVAVLVALPLLGACGFVLIEDGWTFFDGLYMAVTTLSTVGFQEVHPLSTAGRVFVIFYLVIGLGVFLFGIVQLGEMAVRAELRDWLQQRRRGGMIKSMRDHYIVCGMGRIGNTICQQLAAKKLPFVAIDRSLEALADAQQQNWPWLVGDANDDRTLLAAGVERARGLAAVLPADADNLYVVLSARLLRKELQIVCRAADDASITKMEKAGADRVISPYRAGAIKLARLLTNPKLDDFMELLPATAGGLDLGEIRVSADSPYAGRTLSETDFRSRGVIIVGIRRANGELLLPPTGGTRMEVHDELIALGQAQAIAELGGK